VLEAERLLNAYCANLCAIIEDTKNLTLHVNFNLADNR